MPQALSACEDSVGDKLRGGVGVDEPDEAVD